MNIFDMSISSVLDALSYGSVLVYGLVLAAAIAGSFETARQRRIVLWLCPVFLLVQLLGWLLLGKDGVTQIYPLIVHLPLVLILVFASCYLTFLYLIVSYFRDIIKGKIFILLFFVTLSLGS